MQKRHLLPLFCAVLATLTCAQAAADTFFGAQLGIIVPRRSETLTFEVDGSNAGDQDVSNRSILDLRLHLLTDIWSDDNAYTALDLGAYLGTVPLGTWEAGTSTDRGLLLDFGVMARLRTPMPILKNFYLATGLTFFSPESTNIDGERFRLTDEDPGNTPLGFHVRLGVQAPIPVDWALQPYFGGAFQFTHLGTFSGKFEDGTTYTRTLSGGRIEVFLGFDVNLL